MTVNVRFGLLLVRIEIKLNKLSERTNVHYRLGPPLDLKKTKNKQAIHRFDKLLLQENITNMKNKCN